MESMLKWSIRSLVDSVVNKSTQRIVHRINDACLSGEPPKKQLLSLSPRVRPIYLPCNKRPEYGTKRRG